MYGAFDVVLYFVTIQLFWLLINLLLILSYNQHCTKNEMVLGRAYQPPQRRPMDLACHHLETI